MLGATLALAGDAAREERTSGGDQPAPPPAQKKARRPAKLPQPSFAAAEPAPAAPAAKPAAPRRIRAPRPAKALPDPAPAAAPVFAGAPEPLGLPTSAEPAAPAVLLPVSAPLPATRDAAAAPRPVPAVEVAPAAELPAGLPDAPAEPAPAEAGPSGSALAEPVAAPAAPPAELPAPDTPSSADPAQLLPAATPDVPTPAPRLPEPAFGLAATVIPAAAPAAPAAAPLPAPTTAKPAPVLTQARQPSRAVRLPVPAFGPATTDAATHAATTTAAALAAAPSAPGLASGASTPLRQLAALGAGAARGGLPEPAFGFPPAKPPLTQSAASATLPFLPLADDTALTAPIRAGGGVASGGRAAGPMPVISEDDELILQIETPQGEMSDTVVGYGLRQGVYLPLGALTRFFDLAVAISDEGHYASGWFLDEKRTIALNLRAGTLMVAGRAVPLGRGDAVAYEGELYLRADRFGALFPLDLKVDLRAQTITVKTREPFPFEERMAREATRERLGGRAARDSTQRFAREETPWRALSAPVGEAELRALTDDDLGARVESDLRLAADLAFMTARFYASVSSRDGLTAARLELGRRDPDADLLGPLKATEFQLGDVSTATLPIGLRGISGRGAFVTNAPLEQASIFDAVDLRGDLATGYEVELYRNNTLIGSTRTPVNGQYAFLQVPVDFGLNVFRLVFFGPQGQRREVVRRISVGDGRLAPGQLVYSVGAAQKDVNLFAVRGPLFSPAADYGAWRATAELGYGINRALTATLGAGFYETGGPGQQRERWLAAAGLRSGIGGTALRLDLGLQDGGGHTVEIGAGGKLLGMAYTVSHAEYGGGASDEVRAFTSDPLRRASEFNLNTTLRFGSAAHPLSMPITSQVRRIEFADGRLQTAAALRASLPLGGVLLSNTFDYAALSAPATTGTSRLSGTFDLATLSGSRTRYRASVDYGIAPRPSLTSATIEADRRFGEATQVRAAVTHTLADNQTTLGLSAVRRLGPVSLAFDGSYGFPLRNFALALRMGFSFGRNPLSGRMFLSRPGLTSGGAVALRAFADANGNGHRDPGEAPVPGVTFLSGTEESVSDTAGRALIGSLGDGNRASIRVDADSLPDIALAPARPGIEIVPRPGRIHVSDFAIVTLSDVEGTAYFRADAGTRAVSRLQLRLLRPDGTVAARARSESDGFFLFERLPAGTYRLDLDPAQAGSLKIKLEAPVTLTTGGDGGGKGTVVRQAIYVKSAQ